jgi:hypothetical protein
MKVQRVYVDTSVLGGCFDVEFATWSSGLITDFRKGRLEQFCPRLLLRKLKMRLSLCGESMRNL